MVRANKRLPSAVSVSQSALNNVSSVLQGLPEKPRENWSLREAVAVLQESISAALAKGYSYEEIAEMLSGKGVQISASSLKSYLSAAKRQKGLTSSKGKRTGRRTKKVQTSDVSMNGAATAAVLDTSKASLSALKANSATADIDLPADYIAARRKASHSNAWSVVNEYLLGS
ncbi:hypothetical protein [Leptolyngbya sp. 7M]|uniref:hypothetical protein n=1 Tax=Leptolyngbya sp. 7M TaxID=2812896 RepID=UPI001B8D3AE8|nr:hypothetical protein [Leptolyngbya sp. 7M]QYO62540.1 hypothetical protein JVX88_21060 [Leptolyngbya sp. 7M]